ncbi:uncharacterized protein EI97DRAFT_433969 [Westerdykella ornata]|uniref:Uncharacterized protein n=1 Tax=Westerdykella ornata TaxID=318751 RepID=A0A6A6JHI1_WESOR|nr:uncharacterized protein EI97DRAFT_433969 [Westerdykella ornata]KAF2275563.1 hypothetical protein EI97DRAFT_433969 [Westerdykella ornata]
MSPGRTHPASQTHRTSPHLLTLPIFPNPEPLHRHHHHHDQPSNIAVSQHGAAAYNQAHSSTSPHIHAHRRTPPPNPPIPHIPRPSNRNFLFGPTRLPVGIPMDLLYNRLGEGGCANTLHVNYSNSARLEIMNCTE